MAKKHPNEELCDLMVAEAEQRRAARKTIAKSVVYDTMYACCPELITKTIQSRLGEKISRNARIVGI